MTAKVTPMLRFLRALNKEQRDAFANSVGTTSQYLYQFAAQPEPNPRLKFALALVAESKRIARKAMTEPLTLDDLLIGAPPDQEKT